MRDYDEIISTLTEDEKIQLVLAKTSFTKELCDKIDDNLYSFFNTSIDKQLTNQTFEKM
ncbi:unknown [Clostridium sp. CAG:307]|nr:unknown [Clostridium sp. CAG:307]